MWRKWVTIGVVLFVLSAGMVFWLAEDKVSARPAVASGPSLYIAAEGRVTVRPDQRAILSAEVGGRIEKIFVDNLMPVEKGQLLAVIYNADLEQRIHQMEESHRRAQANYLEMANGFRKEEIEEAAAHVRRAESELEL